MIDFENPTLQALVDLIVPPDSYPSGWKAGVGDFLRSILSTDLQASAPLLETGLAWVQRESLARHSRPAFSDLPLESQKALFADLLEDRVLLDWENVLPSAFAELLIRLTIQGFYGDPENGGNRNAVSWTMIGYRILPEGKRFSPIDDTPPRCASWKEIDEYYSVIVIGAGAGGGVTASVLAGAGHRVLLIERGNWLRSRDLRPDHLRNQRSILGYETPAGPPISGNPRVVATEAGDLVLAPTDPRWHNNAMTAGGGTRVYGAQAWRFCPEDFRMATTYGVPEASSLADWPISYDDLEPFYDRVEWEIGVCGQAGGDQVAGHRSRPYPMPPLPETTAHAILHRGAQTLNLMTGSVPLLINSVPRAGRGACLQCGACVGFGCPGEFKNATHNTVIPQAIATGRCDLLLQTRAEKLHTDTHGSITGVDLVTDAGGSLQRRSVRAGHVVLAGGAIETARLLLNSRSAREPNGIGNNHDQVGRNLQGHVYTGAIGVFDDMVQDCIGPGPCIATNDYRHHNPGCVGGGMLANDFVPTPINTWSILTSLGVIPSWGTESKQGMRDLYSRLALVMGPVQEVPNPESRVTVDPQVRDSCGIPVARLSGRLHSEDLKTAAFLAERAVAWLRASGARTAVRLALRAPEGPSAGQHQAGTCRMGTSPASSVTDAWGRIWGHRNLIVADGSLHVTNGGVNPVLTILANAYRISTHLAAELGSNPS